MTAVARQTRIGLSLAALIVGAWLALHIWGVFFQPVTGAALWFAPLLILIQSWLGAGMFIVAHDAMHGSLAPGRSRLNAVIGQICVGAYAGFSFRKLNAAHHQHHRAPGTADDPDFHAEKPTRFGPWFVRFFTRYYGWREHIAITMVVIFYAVIGANVLNLVIFWGLPAILSAMQLFVFGTWLPHRHHRAGPDFADHHQARTLDMPWIASLATCFHFGLHHEHHLSPTTPWWDLPRLNLEGIRRVSTSSVDPVASVPDPEPVSRSR